MTGDGVGGGRPSPRTVVTAGLLCLLTINLAAAQVNVEFDGEMVAEESSRVTQKSWLPWSRGSSGRRRSSNRLETTPRPLYLSEPWPEDTWLPPPPVLTHLANPHSSRLPSLRFPPQQLQWRPRPPPGARVSPVEARRTADRGKDGQEWQGSARPQLKQGSSAKDLPPRRGQGYVNPERNSAQETRRDYQNRASSQMPGQRQDQASPVLSPPSVSRREYVELSRNQVTAPPPRRGRPQATRRRYETSERAQLTETRQRYRTSSRNPPPAADATTRQPVTDRPRGRLSAADTTSRQPLTDRPRGRLSVRRRRPPPPPGSDENEWLSDTLQEPWRTKFDRYPTEEHNAVFGRPVAPTFPSSRLPSQASSSSSSGVSGGGGRGDSTDYDASRGDGSESSTEAQPVEWGRPGRRRVVGGRRPFRPVHPSVPPPPSIDYAHLALGALAANEAAASLGTTEATRSNTEPGSRSQPEGGHDWMDEEAGTAVGLTAGSDTESQREAAYGWTNDETGPGVVTNTESDAKSQTEAEYDWVNDEAEHGAELSGPAKSSFKTEIRRSDSTDEPELFTGPSTFTEAEAETESATSSSVDVAAELAALSALLSGSRDPTYSGSTRAPSRVYEKYGKYGQTITRAALSSDDVIRVPIGRPNSGVSTVSDATTATELPEPAAITEPAAVSEAGQASSTEESPTKETEAPQAVEDTSEYEYYEYDDYYNYEGDQGVDNAVSTTDSTATTVRSDSTSTLGLGLQITEESVNTGRPTNTDQWRDVVTAAPSKSTAEESSTEEAMDNKTPRTYDSGRGDKFDETARYDSQHHATQAPDARTETSTTVVSVSEEVTYSSLNVGKDGEVDLYNNNEIQSTTESNYNQHDTAEAETGDQYLADQTDGWWNNATEVVNDVINNVISDVIHDVVHDTETTTLSGALPAESEITNEIQYPENETEIYDSEFNTPVTTTEATGELQYPGYETEVYHDELNISAATTEPTGELQYLGNGTDIYDEFNTPATTTEATEEPQYPEDETEIYDELDTLATTTESIGELQHLEYRTEIYDELDTPVTTAEAIKVVTFKPSTTQFEPQNDITTMQPPTTETTTRVPVTLLDRASEETFIEENQVTAVPDTDLAAQKLNEFHVSFSSETTTGTEEAATVFTMSPFDEGSVESEPNPVVTTETSTTSPRTRLYLFSNFPEFTGNDERSEAAATGGHAPATDQETGSTTGTTLPEALSGAKDGQHTTTTGEPAAATTNTPEITTSPYYTADIGNSDSDDTHGTVSTSEPDVARTDKASSQITTTSEPYTTTAQSAEEPATTATTQGPVTTAEQATVITRRPIPSLLSRPTFSKFYRFGKGVPSAITEPTTTQRSSAQPVTEPTSPQTTEYLTYTQSTNDFTSTQPSTDFTSTQPSTEFISPSSQPTTEPTSTSPPTTAPSTSAAPETVTTRAAPPSPPGATRAASPSKPSLGAVRAAIQPFSLAEMLVESGQSLAGFLSSDYTMADVLGIIERLRARREGRPVTPPEVKATMPSSSERKVGENNATSMPEITGTESDISEESEAVNDASQTQRNEDAVSIGGRLLSTGSQKENWLDTAQESKPVRAEANGKHLPSGSAPSGRKRKQWSLAEILAEKELSLPAFLAQGGDVKQLLLEYNGVELSSGESDRPDPPNPSSASSMTSPSTTARKVYSLAEILSLRRQTLKQFISDGGNVRAILEEYNGVGWRRPSRITTAAPASSSHVPAFLTRPTLASGAAQGDGRTAQNAAPAPAPAPAAASELRPLLGEGGGYGTDSGDERRGSQMGIRLMTPASPIYGRPPPPPKSPGDSSRLPPPPGSASPPPARPPILPPDELFERINQETEAVWAAAGGGGGGTTRTTSDGSGGGGGDARHEVDSTVFDIDLAPSAGISAAVRNAVITSGVVGGCALLFFVALLLFCKWRQRHEQQALRPGLAVSSERSSSPLDPSRININNYANAYRHKSAGFWGSLRKSFNQRYAAAYSESPFGGVNT